MIDTASINKIIRTFLTHLNEAYENKISENNLRIDVWVNNEV